ncbi:MAG: PAS domain-containing protein [Pseudorhodobacter sp.]
MTEEEPTIVTPPHPSQMAMAEILPHMVFSVRPDGRLDWINQEFERYTGVKNADLITGRWLRALHPEDRRKSLDSWLSACRDDRTYTTELRIWCVQRQAWHAHLVSVRAQRAPDGTITRWYGSAIDIQHLRDVEVAQELELAFQRLESRIMHAIGRGETLEDVLLLICQGIDAALPNTRTMAIPILPAGFLGKGVSAKLSQEFLKRCEGLEIREGNGSSALAAIRRDVVLVEDTATDMICAFSRSFAQDFGIRSSLSCPVIDSTGACIFVLSCHFSEPHRATETEIRVVRRVAEFIHMAHAATRDRDLLRKSEIQYRTLFDLLPVAVWEEDITDLLKRMDDIRAEGVTDFEAWIKQHPEFVAEGLSYIRILGVNRIARDLHGVETPREIEAALQALGQNPDCRADIVQQLKMLFDGGTEFSGTHSLHRGNGETVDLEIRLLRPSPHSSRLLVVELDRTEQLRAERRFRVVAQATSDVIYENDLVAGRVWVSNGFSQHFGYPPQPDIQSRDFWIEKIHPDDVEGVLAEIDKAIAAGSPTFSQDYRFARYGGQYVPVRSKGVILRDHDGMALRVIGNMVDLSEQQELEQRLRRAHRLEAIGQLTGGIAHDFNNILSIIIGNTEYLKDEFAEGSREYQMLANVDTAAERASELTNCLLTFSRRQSLSIQPTDPNGVIRDLRALLNHMLTPIIGLRLDLAPDIEMALLDRPMFESALVNLCVNARDAMPDGGMVSIATANATLDGTPHESDVEPPVAGRYVRVTVSDTGAGMSASVRTRIFEPFFTTKPAGSGSGLGLPMVYGFVKQSQGQIRVESTPGQGAHVILYLPVAAPEIPPPDIRSSLPATAVTRSFRILVVEDDELVRQHIHALLESMQHHVTSAAQSKEAIELVEAGVSFDLMISDVVMPGGMSGVQLAHHIRELQPDLPILLVSGYSEEIARVGDVFAEGVDFLRKPYRREELSRRINKLLG